MNFLLFLPVFCLAGFMLKLADWLGEKKHGGFKSYLVAAVSAFLFWVLLKTNIETSTLMLSIVIGCVLALKVNRLNLVFGVGVLLVLMVLFGFQPPIFWLLPILTALVILDEYTHEKFSFVFFRFRGFLKTFILLLGLLGLLQPFNVLGFIIFDLTYDLTTIKIEKIVKVI